MYDAQPMSTAASPTKLCNKAMSSGIPVICTIRARQRPTAAPITTAAAITTAAVVRT